MGLRYSGCQQELCFVFRKRTGVGGCVLGQGNFVILTFVTLGVCKCRTHLVCRKTQGSPLCWIPRSLSWFSLCCPWRSSKSGQKPRIPGNGTWDFGGGRGCRSDSRVLLKEKALSSGHPLLGHRSPRECVLFCFVLFWECVLDRKRYLLLMGTLSIQEVFKKSLLPLKKKATLPLSQETEK